MADVTSDAGLTGRVRDALSAVAAEEKRMFGGTCFLLDGRIVASVRHDGDLMVRVDPARADALAAEPGARPAVMGERAMGADWIQVSPGAVEDPVRLQFWLNHALARHRNRGA